MSRLLLLALTVVLLILLGMSAYFAFSDPKPPVATIEKTITAPAGPASGA